MKHGKEVMRSESSGLISRGSDLGIPRPFIQTDDESSDSDFEETHRPIQCEESDELFEDLFVDEEVLSSNFTEGAFSDGNELTSGHYIITNHLQMRNKVTVDKTVCIAWHKFFTYTHSIVADKNLPLIYPEALLFPKLFPINHDGAPVGALPSVMYSEYGHSSVEYGYASLVDHIRVRLNDQTLTTSKDKNYIAWLFDCYMNKLLNNHVSAIAANKGFEHLTNGGISVDDSEFQLPFDEIDSRKQISRLSSMMKFLPWTFFLTLTCNISATMGV